MAWASNTRLLRREPARDGLICRLARDPGFIHGTLTGILMSLSQPSAARAAFSRRKHLMTNWMTGVCEANGISIHYLRTGGSKPPMVLLHGLTGSGSCWSPLARALEDEYDIVMPDARGHGSSSTPLNGYRYEDLWLDK